MRGVVSLSMTIILLLLGGCAKTPEEKEIKKSKEGISIRLEGEVYPSKKEDILATMDGRIKEVLIHPGDKVKKGDMLVRFETTVTWYDIEKTERELKYLKEFAHFIRHSKQNMIDLALVNMARLNLEQLSRLKARGYSDLQEFHHAKSTYASSLKSKYTDDQIKKEKLYSLKERISATITELKKLRHTLYLSQVRSDLSGFIADVNIQPGDFVNKGSKLGTIVNLDKVIVKAGIAPGLLPFIKKGKKVKIDFLTTPPYHVKAKISRVVMVVDPDFGRMTAEVEIPNKNYILQEGTKALVTVLLNKKEQQFIKEHFIENPNKMVYEVKSKNE